MKFRYEDEEYHVQRTLPASSSQSPSSQSLQDQSKHRQSLSTGSRTSAPSKYMFGLESVAVNTEIKPSLSLDADARGWKQPSMSLDTDITPSDCEGGGGTWDESMSIPASSTVYSGKAWLPPVFKTDEEYAMRQLEHYQQNSSEWHEAWTSTGDSARYLKLALFLVLSRLSLLRVMES